MSELDSVVGKQAAREPASAPAARSELKLRSSVSTDASRTRWQSEQVCRWRLISISTDVESRLSKYQQIKWMVSLQLISCVPPGCQDDNVAHRTLCIPRSKHGLATENIICL